jgi:hypothetical protein
MLVVVMVVLCFLLGRYIVSEVRRTHYTDLDWPVKFAIGLCVLFAGEIIRAGTILGLIHFQGATANYATEIGPVITSLALVVIGGMCAIRVMTPAKWGHNVWVGSLVTGSILILISRLV